jgi:hypothetical protein
MDRRLAIALLTLVATFQAAGCEYVPTQFLGGQLIVMQVANKSGRPASLAVASPGNIGQIVGSVEPAIVPSGQTLNVRFSVPPSGRWAIWANGGELMSDIDVRGKRGNVPLGIDIGADGSPSWWCQADCP